MQTLAAPSRMAALTKWASVVAICGCCGRLALAQPLEVMPPPADFMIKSWSMADGLPHLSVTSMAQTDDGYIWVGTLAGLARFDGVRFTVFTPRNCPELPKSRVGRLFKGPDNALFITTERGGGLVVFRNGGFEQLLGSGNEQDEIIACLGQTTEGLIFAARSGAL